MKIKESLNKTPNTETIIAAVAILLLIVILPRGFLTVVYTIVGLLVCAAGAGVLLLFLDLYVDERKRNKSE